MDTLPPELIHQIVLHLPKSSLPSFRLASRTFNLIAFPYLFSHIPHWLDYERSHQTIIALAQGVFNRPAVMWSPWASEPDGPIDKVWMGIVWKVLMSGDPHGMKGGLKGNWENLTPGNFGELSGREEITENRLRTGQNRFLMYRDYVGGGSKW